MMARPAAKCPAYTLLPPRPVQPCDDGDRHEERDEHEDGERGDAHANLPTGCAKGIDKLPTRTPSRNRALFRTIGAREREPKSRSFIHLPLRPHASVVAHNHAVHDGEPHPGPRELVDPVQALEHPE